MSNWREGQRVKVVSRPVTEEDRKANRYFEHMAGLTGTISAVFAVDQIAVNVDQDSLTSVSKTVHKHATERMREKFLNSVGEEQKKLLTNEELKFNANFVLLVRSEDLEAA
jgi:hypothetical protein